MFPNMDRLAEEWYSKWDPEFDDDEEDEEEADYTDVEPYDIAKEEEDEDQ